MTVAAGSYGTSTSMMGAHIKSVIRLRGTVHVVSGNYHNPILNLINLKKGIENEMDFDYGIIYRAVGSGGALRPEGI
ncbi:hypothetical protein KL86DYS1_12125 [uncultured Dysgonomonas sp.]|uniref:Uncharacterized protein n=1 Tax=uncultured Dysgonomonas sp. TaxID=206096 RepID=A0A212JFN7_9BACT|nr:hypothetical protein KL86DYS1_12125 [uncultured Dysgonomonas sp.]